MTVIVDSREQSPFTFKHDRYGVHIQQGTLTVGDYSLAGLTDKVAVERKELSDLVQCLGQERERFERELQRRAALDAFAVVIEAGWTDLSGGHFRSHITHMQLARVCWHSWPATGCPFSLPRAGPPRNMSHGDSCASTLRARASSGQPL